MKRTQALALSGAFYVMAAVAAVSTGGQPLPARLLVFAGGSSVGVLAVMVGRDRLFATDRRAERRWPWAIAAVIGTLAAQATGGLQVGAFVAGAGCAALVTLVIVSPVLRR